MKSEKIYHSRLNTKNGIEITSVGSFLDEINRLREKDEDYSQKYFFRGQMAEYWDISSSIFREKMLNVEHLLLKEPIERYPEEFQSIKNTFDLMTKCQHYGLCTRLLDLTTNPLVALYFACQKNGKQEYEKDPEQEYDDNLPYENLEPWGVIYYKKSYPIYSDEKKVKIITELAKCNLQNENSLKEILDKLAQNEIISSKDKSDWLGINYKNFIDIIQDSYVVQPTQNNTRLTAQSGTFLLPGMFSYEQQNNIPNGIITKCKGNLVEQFEKVFFYILGENKDRILEELETCNINESTLFPELEHQLKHIKTINSKKEFDAPSFSKYSPDNEQTLEKIVYSEIDYNEFSLIFDTALQKYLQNNYPKMIAETFYNIFMDNICVDWFNKQQIIGKIRYNITKNLVVQKRIPKDEALNTANKCVSDVVKLAKDLISSEGNTTIENK